MVGFGCAEGAAHQHPRSDDLDPRCSLRAEETVKSAVRRSAIATAVFCVLYWIGLVVIYPTLTPSKRVPSNPGAAQ